MRKDIPFSEKYSGGDEMHQIIAECMDAKHIGPTELSEAMGEIPQSLGQQLRIAKTFKYDRFVSILQYLGYDVELKVKDTGYRRVCPEYLQKIRDTKEPKGLFYTIKHSNDSEWCSAVDNRGDEPQYIMFENKDMMYQWLDEATGND